MKDPLIDVNVYLGQWPTRRLAGDENAQALGARLAARGVTEAWVGSFDGLFHKDLAAVNARLAESCREVEGVRLVPFGAINPIDSNWEAELDRCAGEHGMPGIRLHPNYHGYALDHAAFAKLLRAAAERGLIVSLAPVMEDARMMHPRLRVPAVDLGPLAALVKQTAGLRLLLLNALRRSVPEKLVTAGEVYFEIGMLEGLGGLERSLQKMPLEKVLFGSYSPAFYFESAQLKLRESRLGHHQRRAIMSENARRLLPGR